MNNLPSLSDVGLALALANLLPDSAPILTNVLATGHYIARCRVAEALMTRFSHPGIKKMSRMAPLNALHDPDAGVRMSVASVLQFWKKRLDLVVPALTAVLG